MDSVKLKLQLEPVGDETKDKKAFESVEPTVPMTVRGCSTTSDPPLSSEKRQALLAAVENTTQNQKALKTDGRRKTAGTKMAAKKAKAKSKSKAAKKKEDEESNTLDSEEEPSSEQPEEESCDEDVSQKQAEKARFFVQLFCLAHSHNRFSLSPCHLN